MKKLTLKEKVYMETLFAIGKSGDMLVKRSEAVEDDGKSLKDGYIEYRSSDNMVDYYRYDPQLVDENINHLNSLLNIKNHDAIKSIKFWVTFWSVVGITGLIAGALALIVIYNAPPL